MVDASGKVVASQETYTPDIPWGMKQNGGVGAGLEATQNITRRFVYFM